MKPVLVAALAIGCSLASLGTAQATVVGSFTTTLPADNYTTPSFTTGAVIAGATGTEIPGGPTVGFSPYGDNTSKYVDIINGTASYNFGSLYNGVSFVWGSPDTYNVITFLDQSGNTVGTYTGQDANLSSSNSYYATLTSTVAFNRVDFSSSQAAFEVTSVSPVPLPPALYLFMAALAGLGGLAFFRKRTDDSLPGVAAA